jgi:hypothetical protein
VAKNYIIAQFQTINPRIEWDNELVALAGTKTFCGTKEGRLELLTRDGESIGGMIETTKGERSDSESVNGYVTDIVSRWMRAGSHDDQIRAAKRFGCSNLPACSGSVVVTCLFSPGFSSDYTNDEPKTDDEPQPDAPYKEELDQTALAFTPYQIQLAEKLLKAKWDRVHHLEDLSGFETRCAMLDSPKWPFIIHHSLTQGKYRGLYGTERNNGNVDLAVERILASFNRIPDDSVVGCSIIPDCIRGGDSYVVVSCLYI